jgi:P pilus assembly chaperone PapD
VKVVAAVSVAPTAVAAMAAVVVKAAAVVAAVSVVATATDRSASLQIKRLPREPFLFLVFVFGR